MDSWSPLLTIVHLIGLALGMGAATVKLGLLLKSRADPAFVPVYSTVAKAITRYIVLGMILVTLSGIGWLLLGYPFTPRLVVKLVLVAAIWVMGPLIDNVAEPRFRKLAPAPGEPAAPAFLRIQRQYLALEITATLMFYVIILVWLVG